MNASPTTTRVLKYPFHHPLQTFFHFPLVKVDFQTNTERSRSAERELLRIKSSIDKFKENPVKFEIERMKRELEEQKRSIAVRENHSREELKKAKEAVKLASAAERQAKAAEHQAKAAEQRLVNAHEAIQENAVETLLAQRMEQLNRQEEELCERIQELCALLEGGEGGLSRLTMFD